MVTSPAHQEKPLMTQHTVKLIMLEFQTISLSGTVGYHTTQHTHI